LAYLGKTPIEGFIDAIKAALIALGAVHALTGNKPDTRVEPPSPAS
jgi:hypothetical protein